MHEHGPIPPQSTRSGPRHDRTSHVRLSNNILMLLKLDICFYQCFYQQIAQAHPTTRPRSHSQLPSLSCPPYPGLYRLPLSRSGRFTRNILRSTAIQKLRLLRFFFGKFTLKSAFLEDYYFQNMNLISDLPTSLERPRPAHHIDAFKIKFIFQIGME